MLTYWIRPALLALLWALLAALTLAELSTLGPALRSADSGRRLHIASSLNAQRLDDDVQLEVFQG